MANSKKKNFYYVLVLANDGPAFVTSIRYSDKTAYWNKEEKPLLMSKSEAENLAYCLKLNFYSAFMVQNEYEMEEQPYRYNLGRFKWVNKEDQTEEEEQTEEA